jgi:hypothetical protein
MLSAYSEAFYVFFHLNHSQSNELLYVIAYLPFSMLPVRSRVLLILRLKCFPEARHGLLKSDADRQKDNRNH